VELIAVDLPHVGVVGRSVDLSGAQPFPVLLSVVVFPLLRRGSRKPGILEALLGAQSAPSVPAQHPLDEFPQVRGVLLELF
jgi:hypothetical protein